MRFPIAPDGIFWSIQGEGHLQGFQMAFLRLGGCSVGCPTCDTDYSVAEKLTIEEIHARLDDNGAFVDFQAERPWRATKWLMEVDRMRSHAVPPDFCVAPDIVGGGTASLEHSLKWLHELDGLPAYLAVQDGMTRADVVPLLEDCLFAGLFVGGTLPWKLETGHEWVDLAHEYGLQCHIGRVGTGKRVRWAKDIGADSIDSCLPLWEESKLRIFVDSLRLPQQQLFGGCA